MLLKAWGETHKQQANNKPDGSDSSRIGPSPPSQLRRRKRLGCHTSYRGECEYRQRRPGHGGTQPLVLFIQDKLPSPRLPLPFALVDDSFRLVAAPDLFPSNKVFPQDFEFKLFLRCAASVLRGC